MKNEITSFSCWVINNQDFAPILTSVKLKKYIKKVLAISFNFKYFVIKPPQKVFSDPYKLSRGGLIKIWPRTTEIRPFLGQILAVFDHCEIDWNFLENLAPSIFDIFNQTTANHITLAVAVWSKSDQDQSRFSHF